MQKEVIEYFAFLLKDEIKSYLDEKKAQEDALKKLEDEGRNLKKAINTLTSEISALNLQVVNTQAAVDGINKILKDSDFRDSTSANVRTTRIITRSSVTPEKLQKI